MRGLALVLALLLSACSAPSTPPGPPLSVPQLKYRVFDDVGRPWYCDRDFYPIARADEKDLAVERFPEVQADVEYYQVILARLGLAAAANDDQKLAIYREWKQLHALELQRVNDQTYGFQNYRVMRAPNALSGALVEGRVTLDGHVTVLSTVAAGAPNCPICLAFDVRIATPTGEVLVTALRAGDLVWTLDARGKRVAAPIVAVGSVVAPRGHEVVRLALADGRVVRLSPGHPLADGRRAGDLRAGDVVDGGAVVSTGREAYAGETHDLLPAGSTGTYWANGILLGSTLR